jgi:hypothetical protein
VSIEFSTPVQQKPDITHTTILGFSISGLTPEGWTLPPREIHRTPFLRIDLVDAVRTAPGVFEVQGVREVFYSGQVVRDLIASEATRLRGMRRALEDFLVAQGGASGTAATD